MADRPSVKDILAMARKGGAAKPAEPAATSAPAEEHPAATVEEVPAAERTAAAPEPAVVAAPAPSLGRPLTLKEKLAAAGAGGSAPPPAAAKAAPAPVASVPEP